ncbi:MAG: ribonucleoside-diphosphate reductase subunit alpha [Candidatus Falkowbacteria bacterium]
MLTYKVKKRNGELVDFNLSKIELAIDRALTALDYTGKYSAKEIALAVENKVIVDFVTKDKALSVEDVQDLTEKELMALGAYDVAKAYILYRSEHQKQRELKKDWINQEIKNNSFKINNEKGELEFYNETFWREKISNLAIDLNYIDLDTIIVGMRQSLYEGITTKELNKALINSVIALIERHYNYSYLASRLLLNDLSLEILGDKTLNNAFADYIKKGIEYELLDPELANFNLEIIAGALKAERDNNFQFLGAQTIYDRYLLKTPFQPRQVFELPQWMWMRIAMGLALKEDKREERAIEFYNTMSEFLLIPSTPTLFNSGTTHSQLSSCYLNSVEDSLSGIFKSFSDVASLSKWSGGVGTDWTNVRAMGSKIKGTNGDSQGIIPFIKIFNDIAVAVNQGGKRRGALAAYLEPWHKDIEEFLELKKNTGDERRRAHDIHPAVWIPDLFMKRVIADGEWTLFSPDEVPGLHEAYGKNFEHKYLDYELNATNIHSSKTIKARDLWRKMLTMLFETGHPWITFKDPCNLRSPQDHVGTVHNSNLCTEITLNNSKNEVAVCNLASLNLTKMVVAGKLDNELIKKTVRIGMRMLDNVIDINYYSIPETEKSNSLHRPVGLGLMGYHDALYQIGINFASEANVAFADKSMELISYYAYEASSDLALERGSYQSYPGSKWSRGLMPLDTLQLLEDERGVKLSVNKNSSLDWDALRTKIKTQGMRNSNCLAIAPTATISNIAGSVPCVEPIFKNIYSKENMSGSFTVINRYLVDDLLTIGLWNKEMVDLIKYHNGSVLGVPNIPVEIKNKYRETFEIEAKWVIAAAAARGKWIDQSASTNIFISGSSGKELSDLYVSAWETGLKTTYYLRTLAASQISKTIEVEIPKVILEEAPKACLINNPDCEACQ